jgi:hypothetical protein
MKSHGHHEIHFGCKRQQFAGQQAILDRRRPGAPAAARPIPAGSRPGRAAFWIAPLVGHAQLRANVSLRQ